MPRLPLVLPCLAAGSLSSWARRVVTCLAAAGNVKTVHGPAAPVARIDLNEMVHPNQVVVAIAGKAMLPSKR